MTKKRLKEMYMLVNKDIVLFSLLYDLDLLPEQVKEKSKEWCQMLIIIEHWSLKQKPKS